MHSDANGTCHHTTSHHIARVQYELIGLRPFPPGTGNRPLCQFSLEPRREARTRMSCAGHIMYGPVYIPATYLRRATPTVQTRRGRR